MLRLLAGDAYRRRGEAASPGGIVSAAQSGEYNARDMRLLAGEPGDIIFLGFR